MATTVAEIKRDLGPYWKHEGLDVDEHAKTLAEILSRAVSGPGHRTPYIEIALEDANRLLKGHGVEPIRGRNEGGYWQDVVALYVNMGDTYNATVLYDVEASEFLVTSYGDWVEQRSDELSIE
jgi:hypothetical protein